MPLPTGRSYGVFTANVPFGSGDYSLQSAHEGILADTGGVIKTATPIVGQIAHITTAGNSSSPYAGIALPPWAPGFQVTVYNDTANPIQVFPNPLDNATVNDGAANVAIVQMPNSVSGYTACLSNGVLQWHCPDAGQGYASGTSLPTVSFSTIAANVTGTQASGVAVTTAITNVTAAGTNYSITLPVSVPGMSLTINNISVQTVKVFPNAAGTTTEVINALSANAAISMLTATSAQFICVVAGQWWTCPRVPS